MAHFRQSFIENSVKTDTGRQRDREETDRMLALEEQRRGVGRRPLSFAKYAGRVPGPRGMWWVGKKPLPTRKVSTAAGLRVYFAKSDAQGRRRWSQADHEILIQQLFTCGSRRNAGAGVWGNQRCPSQPPFAVSIPAGAQLLGTHFLSQTCGVGLAAGHACRCPPGDAGRGHPGRAGGARWRRLLREALRASAARGPAA